MTVGAGGSVGVVSTGVGTGFAAGGAGVVRERVCSLVGTVLDQAERSFFAGSEAELAVGAPRSAPPSFLRLGGGAGSVADAAGVSVGPSALVGWVTGGAGSGVRAAGSGDETGGGVATTGVIAPTVASGVCFGA